MSENLPPIENLPESLQPGVRLVWSSWCENAGDDAPALPAAILASLPAVWAASPFVAGQCIRRPALLRQLVDSGRLRRARGERVRSRHFRLG